MTPQELQYKRTVNRIAIALLFFLLMFNVQGVILGVLTVLLSPLSLVWYNVVYELISGLLYAATFCVPVALFFAIPMGTSTQPMRLSYRMPRGTLAYVFFGLSVISVAATVNALLVSVFDYADFSNEMLWDTATSSNYELVLLFFTLAVVPAFVEEFLFRGVVLSNLLPYGRTVAILGSALLFGMMHQNMEQLLYATAAGVVLGWIYVETDSIWPCVLLHLCNNFRSVLQTALIERLDAGIANTVLYAMEGTILLLGVLCAVYLFLRSRKAHAAAPSATNEASEAADTADAVPTIAPARCARLFFTVPMIVFLALCAAQMLLLLAMALLLY